MPSNEILEQTASALQIFGNDLARVSGRQFSKTSKVHLGLVPKVWKSAERSILDQIPLDTYDGVIVWDATHLDNIEHLINRLSHAAVVGFANSPSLVATQLGAPVFHYPESDAVRIDLLRDLTEPPKGFRQVHLKDVASIFAAPRQLPPSKGQQHIAATPIVQISLRDVLPDGSISSTNLKPVNPANLNVSAERLQGDLMLRPNDILISSFNTGSSLRAAVVSPDFATPATFASSLILIRVDDTLARPRDVLNFLQSERGQSLMRLLATRGTLPRISPSTLQDLPIFLPETAKAEESAAEALSDITQVISELRQDILPSLENIQSTASESRASQRQLVADKLRLLSRTLVPASLYERVISEYPMPIALAYRRLVDARFDAFQQVLRLRDVFEATAYFIYNTILSDWLRRLDPNRYFIEDAGARRAFNGYSMSARIDFVAEILRIAHENADQQLFMPELTGTSFVDYAGRLQDDFRNRLSHTGAQSESQQKRIFDLYRPLVEQMLEELGFLANYRLARVISVSSSHSKLWRRMELYRGIAAGIDEQRVSSLEGLALPDRGHIVLLDPQEDILDLYPVYQLLANEETRHESHLCFFKQRKQSVRLVEGESVQGMFEVTLDGFDELDAKLAIIREKKV